MIFNEQFKNWVIMVAHTIWSHQYLKATMNNYILYNKSSMGTIVGCGPASLSEMRNGRLGFKPIPGFVLHGYTKATNIAVAK